MTYDLDETTAIVSGSGARGLGRRVGELLGAESLERRSDRFPDGELDVAVDPGVEGRDIYLIQSLAPPVNERIMELLLLADACKRESAERITAVLPYLGYARKDRRTSRGEPVALAVVARVLAGSRIDRIAVMDPHVRQVEPIFDVPVTVISAVPELASALEPTPEVDDVVVAPDAGAIELAESYAGELGLDRVAVVLKDRRSGSEVTTSGVAGDAGGGSALIVDDMITTGGTIEAAAAAVRKAWGPAELRVVATHPVLVGDAIERVAGVEPTQVVVSDTIPHDGLPDPYRVVGVAGVIARHISRLAG